MNVEPYGQTMPPWPAMPFTAAPIACSRTPKKMLRPAFSAVKRSDSGKIVFVDSVRSAAPPSIVGVNGSNAAMTWPPAPRVAIFSLPSNVGSASAMPGSGRPGSPHAASHSAARSASSPFHFSRRSDHSAWALPPSSFIENAS